MTPMNPNPAMESTNLQNQARALLLDPRFIVTFYGACIEESKQIILLVEDGRTNQQAVVEQPLIHLLWQTSLDEGYSPL